MRDRRAEREDFHQRPGRRAGHGRGEEDRRPQAEHREVAVAHPSIRKVWVDGGYRQHLVEHAATVGIDMEIVQRTPGAKGFPPLPKRWTVERTYGWLMFHRRLARDYETLPARSEA